MVEASALTLTFLGYAPDPVAPMLRKTDKPLPSLSIPIVCPQKEACLI